MNNSPDLAALTKRLENLEAKVGTRCGQQPLVPYLAEYSTDLGNCLAGNDRVVPLLRRIEELETLIDPLFGEAHSRTDGVRWSLVESQSDRLNNNLERLQRLEKMTSSLDDSNLKKAEDLTPKLAELSQVQVEQREDGDALSVECMNLIQQYNNIIASLTDAFNQADQLVTQAEEKAGFRSAE